jgi:hypothetical protein
MSLLVRNENINFLSYVLGCWRMCLDLHWFPVGYIQVST